MKLNDRIKPVTLGGIDISKIKGHTTIILKDVRTGKEERFEDTNMMTNAIQNYFANCGFLNFPDLDKDTLVENLLGGVLCLDDTITEQAGIVRVPPGVKMTANCCVGQNQALLPSEMGIYSAEESGWQGDGSYKQTYDWTTTRGNGTIACVCLTSKAMGYVGIGNATSGDAVTSGSLDVLTGSTMAFRLSSRGYSEKVAKVNLEDSTAYGIDFSDLANGNITIRKYRIPTSKVNLKGTTTSCEVLETTTITTSDADAIALSTMLTTGGFDFHDDYSKFYFWNTGSSGTTWGTNYTQYLFELDPALGTLTKKTILNTSGATLHCMGDPVFLGDGKIAFIDDYEHSQSTMNAEYIYIYDPSDGTMMAVENIGSARTAWTHADNQTMYDVGDGRLILGYYNNVFGTGPAMCLDSEGELHKINMGASSASNRWFGVSPTSSPLVKYAVRSSDNYQDTVIHLRRKVDYIATINNLEVPVAKTAEKAMKVIYTISFDNEEEE